MVGRSSGLGFSSWGFVTWDFGYIGIGFDVFVLMVGFGFWIWDWFGIVFIVLGFGFVGVLGFVYWFFRL